MCVCKTQVNMDIPYAMVTSDYKLIIVSALDKYTIRLTFENGEIYLRGYEIWDFFYDIRRFSDFYDMLQVGQLPDWFTETSDYMLSVTENTYLTIIKDSVSVRIKLDALGDMVAALEKIIKLKDVHFK